MAGDRKKSNAERQFRFVLKSKKDVEEYNRRIAEEKKKSRNRGIWGSIGSIVGAIVGVALAPVTGGMSLVATSAIVGGSAMAGSYLGGHGLRQASETYFDQGREDITTADDPTALTENISAQATEDFKQIEQDEEDTLNTQAIISGVTAGVMHGVGGGVTGDQNLLISDKGFTKAGGRFDYSKTIYGKGADSLSFGQSLSQNIGTKWMGGIKEGAAATKDVVVSEGIKEGVKSSAAKNLLSSVGKGLGQSAALMGGKALWFSNPPDEQIQEKQDYPRMNLA
jgi:hypothetical protein